MRQSFRPRPFYDVGDRIRPRTPDCISFQYSHYNFIVSTIIPIFALLADVVVLSATWIKTRTIRKDAKCGGTKARLSTLLLRDGSIYFLCHFILNALELALTRAQNASIEAGMFTTLAMKSVPSFVTSPFTLYSQFANQDLGCSRMPLHPQPSVNCYFSIYHRFSNA
ncbi:hypothetical protein C8Q75DRAFT_448476 [Abortiporus biennis]|nr:hypothetical protein C8Q75DRAFT_448476 [Abortiporus biennis]